MKKLFLLAIATILTATAATNAATVTVSTGYYNQYLSFGSGAVLHGRPVIQSSIDINFDCGLYLGLWNSYSPDGELNPGDELDYKIGWTGNIGKKWTGDFSVLYFDEPKIGTLGSGDIWRFALGVSRPIGDYTFGFTAKCYVPTDGSPFEGGWLIGPSINHNFKLRENLSLFCDIGLAYDDGGFGMDNGFVLNINSSLDLKVSEQMSWSIVQGSLYQQLGTSDSRKGTDTVLGSCVKIKF